MWLYVSLCLPRVLFIFFASFVSSGYIQIMHVFFFLFCLMYVSKTINKLYIIIHFCELFMRKLSTEEISVFFSRLKSNNNSDVETELSLAMWVQHGCDSVVGTRPTISSTSSIY